MFPEPAELNPSRVHAPALAIEGLCAKSFHERSNNCPQQMHRSTAGRQVKLKVGRHTVSPAS